MNVAKLPITVTLALLMLVTLTLSSCGPASSKPHARGDVPYTFDWGSCLVSVIPIGGDAKYVIQFPDTLKKLQFVNPYESPKDFYIAIKAFPYLHTDCWPNPASSSAATSTPCNSTAITATLDARLNQPGGWKVLGYACQDGYAFAMITPVTGGMQAVAILQQQGSTWKILYSGEGLCLPPGQNQSMCQGYKQPMPIALLESLMRRAGYLR